MSIFIKGMEMPKSCNKCFFRHITLTDNDYCLATREKIPWEHRKEKQDFCPLIELPPHGRLIDADALLSENVDPFTEQTILKIKFAPTILEAEEDE